MAATSKCEISALSSYATFFFFALRALRLVAMELSSVIVQVAKD
jgi:hypothetical protein